MTILCVNLSKMGCSCKKDKEKSVTISSIETISKKQVGIKMVGVLMFAFSMVFLPLIILFIVYVLFKHFIIGGDIDMSKLMKKIKNSTPKSKEDTVDIEDIKPEEYILVDSNITEIK